MSGWIEVLGIWVFVLLAIVLLTSGFGWQAVLNISVVALLITVRPDEFERAMRAITRWTRDG